MGRHMDELRAFESKVGQQLTEEEFRAHWKGSLAYTGAELADALDELGVALTGALPAPIRRWLKRE